MVVLNEADAELETKFGLAACKTSILPPLLSNPTILNIKIVGVFCLDYLLEEV